MDDGDGTVRFEVVDPATSDAQFCLRQYFDELDRRFDTGFDPAQSLALGIDDLRLPHGLLVVATQDGAPVACGALRFHPGQPAYLKRMWVSDDARGLGLGRRLLAELEALAAAHGVDAVHLETNRTLTEAIALYRSAGYQEVEPFNDEPYAHHWFHKNLPHQPPDDLGA